LPSITLAVPRNTFLASALYNVTVNKEL